MLRCPFVRFIELRYDSVEESIYTRKLLAVMGIRRNLFNAGGKEGNHSETRQNNLWNGAVITRRCSESARNGQTNPRLAIVDGDIFSR